MRRHAGATFDIGPLLPIRALGYFLVAGGSLAIAVVGWRARSLSLGFAYVVVGGFFTFLDTITWKLAAQINGAPAVLPEPVASAISKIYAWQTGLLNAVPILGAVTLLVGISMLIRSAARPSFAVDRAPSPVKPGGSLAAKP